MQMRPKTQLQWITATAYLPIYGKGGFLRYEKNRGVSDIGRIHRAYM